MMIEKLGAKNLRSNGRMMIEKVMIQLGAKSPGGGGGAPAPPMMIEKVMIQLKRREGVGAGGSPPHDDRKSDDSIRGKSLKNSGGVGGGGGGGGSPPPTMIEKVKIQLGPKKYLKKKGAGRGISASVPRPHGTSEGSNTGKLIPADRKSDDSIRGKKSKT